MRPFFGLLITTILAVATVTLGGQAPVELSTIEDLMDEGAYEEASALLDSHVKGKHATAQALFLKSTAALMLSDLEEAEEFGDKAVKADRTNPEYWTQLGTIKGLRARNGSKLKAIGRAKGARKDYDKALELDPRCTVALLSKLRYKLYAPGIAGGDKDEARELAGRLLEVDVAQGHLARAEIAIFADQDTTAYRAELEAAAAVATRAEDVYDVARRFLAEGDRDRAWEVYRQAIALDDHPDRGKLRLAGQMLRQGLLDEAEAVLREIKIRGPQGPRAAVGLAQITLRRGEKERAWQQFQDVLQVNPDFPPGKYYLGEQYLLMKEDPAAAIPLLQEYLQGYVRQSWPPRAVAHWRLALAQEQLRDFDRAWENMKQAAEMGLAGDEFESDERRIKFMAED